MNVPKIVTTLLDPTPAAAIMAILLMWMEELVMVIVDNGSYLV